MKSGDYVLKTGYALDLKPHQEGVLRLLRGYSIEVVIRNVNREIKGKLKTPERIDVEFLRDQACIIGDAFETILEGINAEREVRLLENYFSALMGIIDLLSEEKIGTYGLEAPSAEEIVRKTHLDDCPILGPHLQDKDPDTNLGKLIEQ